METVESLTLELSRSKPAASRLPCSLIATSQCGDFLVATQGNTLRYSHYSHKKLWPVFFSDQMADSYLQQTTLFAVRFNLKATAALLAGRACLFAVLPTPRGQDGALCHLEKWSISILIRKATPSVLIDAIFPRQFDDHICSIDSLGVLRFWDVFGRATTKIETGICDVQVFCFGSGLWGRYGIFLLTASRLMTVYPVAPQQCCALKSEITQLQNAFIKGMHHARSDGALANISATLCWLQSTFPNAADTPNAASWVEANARRSYDQRLPLSSSAFLDLRGCLPVDMCLLESASSTIFVIATNDGYVDIYVAAGNIFMPSWDSLSNFKLYHVESLVMVDVCDNYLCLEAAGREVYYAHKRGVTIIELCWLEKIDLLRLDLVLAKSPTRCRHAIFTSDPKRWLAAKGLLRCSTTDFAVLLCFWRCQQMLIFLFKAQVNLGLFDDSSCCAVDTAAARHGLHQINSRSSGRVCLGVLNLASDLTTMLEMMENKMMDFRRTWPQQELTVTNGQERAINDIREFLELNITIQVMDCAKCSRAIIVALHSIHSTHHGQYTSCSSNVLKVADGIFFQIVAIMHRPWKPYLYRQSNYQNFPSCDNEAFVIVWKSYYPLLGF
mmetsp:Transcript_4302/g.13508  ORF Transcript_4302/g.13508 Transcript_4302/m.13508 type:complete len:613 (+) Transcript_4302:177-2015(+)